MCALDCAVLSFNCVGVAKKAFFVAIFKNLLLTAIKTSD